MRKTARKLCNRWIAICFAFLIKRGLELVGSFNFTRVASVYELPAVFVARQSVGQPLTRDKP